jgi:hypothetical protein
VRAVRLELSGPSAAAEETGDAPTYFISGLCDAPEALASQRGIERRCVPCIGWCAVDCIPQLWPRHTPRNSHLSRFPLSPVPA